MTRVDGWEARLWEVLEAAREEPFSRARNDCVRFAVRSIEAITGEALAGELLEKYSSDREALRLLREAGGLEALVTEVLGAPVEAALARRGDLVLVPSGEEGFDAAVGICIGASFAAMGPEGLDLRPMTDAVRAWRVG